MFAPIDERSAKVKRLPYCRCPFFRLSVQRCKEKGLTRAAVARVLGVSWSTVNRVWQTL